MTKPQLSQYLQLVQWGLILLTILSLPWYIIRFNIAGIPVTWLEIVGWMSITAWLSLYGRKWRFKSVPIGYWYGLLACWLIISSISLFMSPDIRAALGIFKAYFILPIAFVAMLYHLVSTSRQLGWLILALLGSGLQIALLCLSQWWFGWPDLAHHELIQGRSSAVFNSANAVGLAIGPIIAIVIAYLMFKRPLHRSNLWLGITSGVGLLAAVYSSHSEGAWLATGISLAVLSMVWLSGKVRLNLKRLYPIALVALAVYVVATIGYIAWYNQPPQVANPYTRPDFTTLTIRQCTWQGTWDSLHESWLWGNGLAGFAKAYLDHATCDAEPFVYPHNIILNFWTELGLLGVALWLATSIIWLKSAISLGLSQSNWSWLGWAGLAALVYWLVHGLVDVPYFKNDLAMVWWLIMCLVVLGLKLQAQVNLPPSQSANHPSQPID